MTCDLHADQIQGFLKFPDHLYASSVFIEHIRALNLNKLTIASPDMGGSKRAIHMQDIWVAKWLFVTSIENNEVGEMRVIGDVKGENIILVDDMVDTAGTLTKAADMMIKKVRYQLELFVRTLFYR